MRQYHVYIMASRTRRLYVGVTGNLLARLWRHKSGASPGFASRYRIDSLVYFEQTLNAYAAIARAKELKRWPRKRKMRLIELTNAGWRDLSVGWFGGEDVRDLNR